MGFLQDGRCILVEATLQGGERAGMRRIGAASAGQRALATSMAAIPLEFAMVPGHRPAN
jgi:hypothetical protein